MSLWPAARKSSEVGSSFMGRDVIARHGAAGVAVVHPFASHVASKSTPYRPSAYICTVTQFWVGRERVPLSSEIQNQPPRSAPAVGGKTLAVDDVAEGGGEMGGGGGAGVAVSWSSERPRPAPGGLSVFAV